MLFVAQITLVATTMAEVSAIIITYNEAEHIVAAIESLAWADEVMVVDSFSSDETVTLAEPIATRVLQRKFTYHAEQKNWAIPQAAHEWVFILDADERVTPALANEIRDLLALPEIAHDAFWIRRTNYFFGKRIRFSGVQGDKVIRLFKRDTCRYNDKQVHEEIVTSGSIGRLRSRLTHHSFRSAEHFAEKHERYAERAASDLMKRGVRPNFFHLKIKPVFRFLKHFVWQLGFLDGAAGYKLSRLFAKSVRLRYERLLGHLRQSQ